MSKRVAVISLTLALGIGTPAKTHHHHQEAMPEVTSNISDTDAWRHYLYISPRPVLSLTPVACREIS